MLFPKFISFAESYGMQLTIFRVTLLAVYKREVLYLEDVNHFSSCQS